MERPIRSAVSSAGSRSRPKNATAAKMPRVRNCRVRYAEAPSCTALAMVFMLSVPSPAASTWDLNTKAITSATSAMRPTMITRVKLPPVSSTVALTSATPKGTRDILILRFGR